MKNYKPYGAYKDSGVEWIGKIPEGWEVIQGKRLFEQKKESYKNGDIQLSSTQKFGVIPQNMFIDIDGRNVVMAINGVEGFKHVECGDFVISLQSFQGGVEFSKYSGCVSQAYTVLRPYIGKDINPHFWSYLLKSTGFICALQTVSEGIRNGKTISYEKFGGIYFPKPTFSDQKEIYIQIDIQVSLIDSIIEKKTRLIELIKERRSAFITAAVTGKIDLSSNSCIDGGES